MLANKHKLKTMSREGKIFIYEDLTQLRSRLLNVVKKQSCVHHAFTTNGRIVACIKDPAKYKDLEKVYLDSPDDLFKLGMSEIPAEDLGLQTF